MCWNLTRKIFNVSLGHPIKLIRTLFHPSFANMRDEGYVNLMLEHSENPESSGKP